MRGLAALLAGLLLAACLALPGAADAPVVAEGAGGSRQLAGHIANALEADFMHFSYTFSLHRQEMMRQGRGELWLSFADGVPQLRINGVANSPRFGQGEIQIVVDGSSQFMYSLLKVKSFNQVECLKYPFPSPSDFAKRMEHLRLRREQFMRWDPSSSSGPLDDSLTMEWNKRATLDVNFREGVVETIRLRRGNRRVKDIQFQRRRGSGGEAAGGFPSNLESIFGPPASDCRLVSDVHDPVATVQLGPHHRSPALTDLLLLLSDRALPGEEHRWPQAFVALSGLTVPGDVAVLIEDPSPPNLGSLAGMAFGYTSTIFALAKSLRFDDPALDIDQSGKHASDGTMFLNLDDRSFRLHEGAAETKVGDLWLDLLADSDPEAGSAGHVYAFVNMTAQSREQCIPYRFPVLRGNETKELEEASREELRFIQIVRLKGQECGIFIAPLARGRWIRLWVDMEAEGQESILRTEVHRNRGILRRTDFTSFQSLGAVPGTQQYSTRPRPGWDCGQPVPEDQQLAHLGLRSSEKWSIELQDVLHSLKHLSPTFAALEVFGLTGDVAIMIQEPEPPDFAQLPAVEFQYVVDWPLRIGDMGAPPPRVVGRMEVDILHQRMLITATAGEGEQSQMVSVAIDDQLLYVKADTAKGSSCLAIKTADLRDKLADAAPFGKTSATFDGVESVRGQLCNRFSLLRSGEGHAAVLLWFMEEEEEIRRVEVRRGAALMRVEVQDFQVSQRPMDARSGGLAGPEHWKDCEFVYQEPEHRWVTFKESPSERLLPASRGLPVVAEAFGTLGILPQKETRILEMLHVLRPPADNEPLYPRESVPHPAPSPPPVGVLSSELKTFSFSFSSAHNLRSHPEVQGPGVAGRLGPQVVTQQHGEGLLKVDLANRRLFLKSKALNVSSGIREVQSTIKYNSAMGRLWVHTVLPQGNFEQCFSLEAMEGAGPRLPTSNPFALAAETFGRGKYVLEISQKERAEFFLGGNGDLIAVKLDDLARGTSAAVTVSDWSTDPVDDGWFEPDRSWTCENMSFQPEVHKLLQWDLLQVFLPSRPASALPPGPAPMPSQGRYGEYQGGGGGATKRQLYA